MRHLLAITSVLGMLLLGSVAMMAQSGDNLRAVEGTVQGADGAPVNGAIVQLKDTKSLQIRSYITRENGAYVFQGLKKSVEYELKARFKDQESKPKLLTIYDDRQRASINLRLE